MAAVMQALIADGSTDVDRTTVDWTGSTCSKPVEMSCRRRRHDINRAKSVIGQAALTLSSQRSQIAACGRH